MTNGYSDLITNTINSTLSKTGTVSLSNVGNELNQVFNPSLNGVADAFDPTKNGVADAFNKVGDTLNAVFGGVGSTPKTDNTMTYLIIGGAALAGILFLIPNKKKVIPK